MITNTCVAALLLHFASTPPPRVVPPDALPQATVQAHPLSPPFPRWSAQALAAWAGPWVQHPGGLYDHRYVTW